MPRITRGLVDESIYHVLNRGNAGEKVFRKEQDFRAFTDLMRKAKHRYAVSMFAYCLMPNHFHMVLMPLRAEYLSKWMQWLMTSHVRRYHSHYGTSGHVWQGRFKSFIIQKDAHLLTALRYVEGNPVRAGLVNSARDWLWSSHRESIGAIPRSLIDEAPLALPEEWDKYVDAPWTEAELATLRQSVNRQRPFGLGRGTGYFFK